jgi:group II intron reverse transcriptase/maturase
LNGLKRLSTIQELSQKNPKWIHRDIFRILRKEDIWIAAYENIKGNKGALTPGVTKETLDGTSLKSLRNLQKEVLEESYKFKPVKQILIPKPNGTQRPLGLPTANDKIVQEVLRMVLEAIYEPIFDTCSFGFRQKRGVHDALNYVDSEFRWVDWVIKGDIKSAYPTIDHNRLVTFIEQRIDDPRFLRLIRKSLKCGVYTNPNTIYSKLGVPQGSIVAPILANIYFHELDNWVKEKGKEIFQKASKKRNPKYKEFEYQIQKLSKEIDKLDNNSTERAQLVKNLKAIIQKRNKVPSLLDQGIELQYARYADDWIIGIKGPKPLANRIRTEVGNFLLDHLLQELDPVKTTVTELRAGKVIFLGYEIFLPRNARLTKYKKKGGKQTIRRSPPQLRFHIPLDTIRKRLFERGYITYSNNKWRPISKKSYSTLEDDVIVLHFSSVWRGISNFYSGATNLSKLQYIHYLLHMSCAMTLAHRHRSTSSKIFKKHGKRLEIRRMESDNEKVIAYFPYRTEWKVGNRRWQCAKNFRDPFSIYANRVSKSRLGKECCICKINTTIEMHHVKHVKKKGHRYKGFHFEMSLLNRKQVPLCRECHLAVHRGDYDGIRLAILD